MVVPPPDTDLHEPHPTQNYSVTVSFKVLFETDALGQDALGQTVLNICRLQLAPTPGIVPSSTIRPSGHFMAIHHSTMLHI